MFQNLYTKLASALNFAVFVEVNVQSVMKLYTLNNNIWINTKVWETVQILNCLIIEPRNILKR